MNLTIHGHIIWLILLIVTLLTIYSCCTKIYCIGADDMNQIWFYNFDQQDLDTIVIKQYEKNSNYEIMLDSSVTITDYFSSRTDFQEIHLTNQLTIDFDYEVVIVSTGQVFTISNFVTEKERCNTGFLCFDYYNSLENYKVNGQTQNEGILKIFNDIYLRN